VKSGDWQVSLAFVFSSQAIHSICYAVHNRSQVIGLGCGDIAEKAFRDRLAQGASGIAYSDRYGGGDAEPTGYSQQSRR
jgi:hypothetical protein